MESSIREPSSAEYPPSERIKKKESALERGSTRIGTTFMKRMKSEEIVPLDCINQPQAALVESRRFFMDALRYGIKYVMTQCPIERQRIRMRGTNKITSRQVIIASALTIGGILVTDLGIQISRDTFGFPGQPPERVPSEIRNNDITKARAVIFLGAEKRPFHPELEMPLKWTLEWLDTQYIDASRVAIVENAPSWYEIEKNIELAKYAKEIIIIGHSSPNSVAGIRKETIARTKGVIQNNKHIRIIGCEAGKGTGSPAELISATTGMEVIASDGYVRMSATPKYDALATYPVTRLGSYFIGKYAMEHDGLPSTSEGFLMKGTAKWNRFYPDGKKEEYINGN